jgi:hypothetical protein
MKTWFGWLMASCVLVLVGSYAWTHRRHIATPETVVAESQPKYAEQEQAGQMVIVTGPMADHMLHEKAGDVETLQPIAQSSSYKSSGKPSASDHASDDTPVGTSKALLHKTFNVAGIVDLPFDLPAHASTAQLRGTYRSFLPHSGVQPAGERSDDRAADVEFLLLNEQQYADLLNGRPGDALFSADDTSNGEVNFSLPPTFVQPAKYYLVFRNSSRGGAKRVVQADFRIDF